ncbi:MAG: DUF362 domain-containing protein [Chloroflexi bacterium]|nr:MAG: DUF362 domain-containing protein [Chloroflexota bacterium]MBL1194138.1 DUF362 domain-containing protein [Chloroflexota bacterium]NOH11431.1 DUF362 domain-containing protein [Chloroflexota bacterium]
MGKSNISSSFNRREFLRIVAALTSISVVSSFLEACSRMGLIDYESATPVPTDTEAPVASPTAEESPTVEVATATSEGDLSDEDKAQLAFVKTTDRVGGVGLAIDLLGVNPVDGKSVFIKPNLNTSDPAPAATDSDMLRALVVKLWDMGATKITVGDRAGMGVTREVMERLGIFAMSEELGFETMVFDELEASDWEMFKVPGGRWHRGFPFARPCLEHDAIVQMCCLKTHGYDGHFTMSLKNSVGFVAKTIPGDSYDYMAALHRSAYLRQMVAEVNTVYTPALIVMDGVESFVNGGPDSGKRVNSEIVLAGTDRIAMDAVGVAVLRHFGTTRNVSEGPIFELDQISRAVQLELGIDGPEKINLLTGDDDSAAYAEEILEQLAAL